MNAKIEKWIENRKSEQRKEFETKRDEHLLKLGLTDDNKTIREYYSYYVQGMKYDKDKGEYFKDSHRPIDVSDEEYAEICRYAPYNDNEIEEDHNGAESMLNVVANIFLVFGILAFLVLLIMSADTSGYDTGFDFATFGYGVFVLMTSMVVFSVLRVLRVISLTLKSVKRSC